MRTIALSLFGVVLSVGGAGAAPSARAIAAIACADEVSTIAETRTCWITQIDQANKSLDQEYRRFLNAVSSGKGETDLVLAEAKRRTLVTAQADWEKYHLAHCNLYMDVFEGTRWHSVSDRCVLGKIEERLRELTALRREYEHEYEREYEHD